MNLVNAQSSMAQWAGQYVLRPGQRPSVVGQRPVLQGGLLARVLSGQTGPALVRLLGNLFSLCAHAHQRAAALAWNAACPQATPMPVPPLAVLRLETARDHLRSMALDWPQRLALEAPQAQALLALATCPLMQATPSQVTATQTSQLLAEMPCWLQARGLVAVDSLLPILNDRSAQLKGLRPVCHALDVLHPNAGEQAARLRELAQSLQGQPEFAQTPVWRGHCAETGAWTRLRHPTQADTSPPSAWSRLSARWHELVEIAHAAPLAEAATHDPLLSSGALALTEGTAIAWCEMARGLLLHWIQVDEQGGVVDYRVLAPTEWNFHPQGALANALTALAPGDVASARCLAAAYDACVDCQIDTFTAVTNHA